VKNPWITRVKRQAYKQSGSGVSKGSDSENSQLSVSNVANHSVLLDSSFEKPVDTDNFLKRQRRAQQLNNMLSKKEIASMRRKIMRDIRSPKPVAQPLIKFNL
jgi:hypothetical protein